MAKKLTRAMLKKVTGGGGGKAPGKPMSSVADNLRNGSAPKGGAPTAPAANAWYGRGYQDVPKRIEENRKRQELFVPDFFVTGGNEANILFLDEEPVTGDFHNIPRIRGKGWEDEGCLFMVGATRCPFCEKYGNPAYKGFYTVFDLRHVHTTKDDKGRDRREMCALHYQNHCPNCDNGVKKSYAGVKKYGVGLTVLSQLQKRSEKHGLTTHMWTVEKAGKSTTFERNELTDKHKLILQKTTTLDLPAILTPKSLEDAIRRLGGSVAQGGSASIPVDDEEVEFEVD